MANAKKSQTIVMLAEQGKAPRTVKVASGATLRSALTAAKLNPDALGGAVTINGEPAELNQRLKTDDYIAVTPKVAGGR